MDTIKSKTQFSTLFANGRRIHTPSVTLIVSKTKCGRQEFPGGRVAFVAGKKNGNAVWRNAAKRRMREIYRSLPFDEQEHDIIFLAKGNIMLKPFAQVKQDCELALLKLAQ